MPSRASSPDPMMIKHVVLVAHADPPIHGQAVAASALLDESRSWTSTKLHHVNAVYAGSRGELTGFTFGKLLKLLRYIIQTIRLVRKTDAQAVIVTPAFFRGPFIKDAVMISAIRALTSAKVVGWVHMDPARIGYGSAPGWFRNIMTSTIGKVDSWCACSTALLDLWPSFLPRNRCVGLPNGIDAPPQPNRPASGGRLKVAYLSAMDREKGWLEALTAARSICSTHRDIEFHFHGNVPSPADEPEVLKAFSEGPHADRIHWHGPAWGDRKWSALADADLFCFPSHTEQFPIAVLDAMAAGLPVVATRVGAVSDAIEPGKGGWLVAPRDAVELEAALLEAISDPLKLRTFGEHNRRRFEERFTRESFGRRWEAHLQSLT